MSTTTRSLNAVVRLTTCLSAAVVIYGVVNVAYAQTSTNAQGSAESGVVLPRSATPFPRISLGRHSRGDEAVTLLGTRLPEVARWYGIEEARFREILRSDRSVRLDEHGRVFYEDNAQIPPEQASSASPPVSGTALAPLDQTFNLHSKPGSQRVIYLDFNGATLTGTAWNEGGGPITAAPYDLDGNPNSFSANELTQIQNIWQRVAEDYAPFDVDVTTEQPTSDALTRSFPADQTFGTTVLITRHTFHACTCGGAAYIGVFDDIDGNFYKPAVVFFDVLGFNEKNIAEAISHEAGHNMGLNHDGVFAHGSIPASEYYDGQGSGATGWAPIMGSGYSRELVQWSRGEYANANNPENDFAVMQANGLPLRQDDHGNSFATATVLTPSGSALLTSAGIIESQSDVDIFRFSAGAGTVSIQVLPAPLSPNLDVLATLQREDGSVLATSNPAEELSASFGVSLQAPATLFLTVQGTGKGNPAIDGYSSYGSVGQYSVRITLPTQSTSVSLGASSSQIDQGQTVTLTAAVSGFEPTGTVTFYDNGVIVGTATLAKGIATLTTPPLSFGVHNFTVIYNGDGVNSTSSSTAPTVVMSGNVAAIIGIINSILLDDDCPQGTTCP